MNREAKIENLLNLIKGKIKPADLQPKRLCMAIGYGDAPIYTINEREVNEEEYLKWAKRNPDDDGDDVFTVTYGDHDIEEGESNE